MFFDQKNAKNQQQHAAYIAHRKPPGTDFVVAFGVSDNGQVGIVKHDAARIANGCHHKAQQAQFDLCDIGKKKQTDTTRCAQITKEFHKPFFAARIVGNRRQQRGKASNHQKTKCQTVGKQSGIDKFITKKQHLVGVAYVGEVVVINRENSGANDQRIHRVCPIVGRPSCDDFFVSFFKVHRIAVNWLKWWIW